jgi:2-polyprenyl-3-methyl-5-hydroxy-6-metoxy-1,4-benzoquinol methylase
MNQNQCRFCKTNLKETIVDLGMSPLANSYLPLSHVARMEPFYPLCLYICHECFLVQVEEVESPANIFTDYAYFSSFSRTWLEHSKTYCDMAERRFNLNKNSLVVEIASNDGYLLQYFLKREINVLGIEPAANVAVHSIEKGIPTVVKFFGCETAKELVSQDKKADLLLGNNVLAHVPDINDFVGGMKIMLRDSGVITMEFPHLLQLMRKNQFDTIYHEHFSYFSFSTVNQIFKTHGMTLFDVEELSTHGGSLRIFAKHSENISSNPPTDNVTRMLKIEEEFGLTKLDTYKSFAQTVRETKCKILSFLIEQKKLGKKLAGFGAPAKGNTLLNYCGIRTDFIDYTVDDTPAKQGRFLPGTHIPIKNPLELKATKPDYLIVMPWNFKEEIIEKHSYVREWGCKFVVFIPEVKIID